VGNKKYYQGTCDKSGKEEQVSSDCGHEGQGDYRHEGQEWYENLKKHFLESEKKNPNL